MNRRKVRKRNLQQMVRKLGILSRDEVIEMVQAEVKRAARAQTSAKYRVACARMFLAMTAKTTADRTELRRLSRR
ncbi:MAG TPA: hypothetical protein VGB13_06655 [Candidatus Krumholzibacteria bacterium]